MDPPSQPIYTIYQKKSRALIPKILSLFLLGSIFYLGILLNVSLLQLRASEESLVKIISLIILLLVIILGTFLALKQAHAPYLFFPNKITVGKKEIAYLSINNPLIHIDLADKIFKTYSLNLGSNFFLRNIPNEVQIQNYVEQLKIYAQNNQRTTNFP